MFVSSTNCRVNLDYEFLCDLYSAETSAFVAGFLYALIPKGLILRKFCV